MNLKAHHGEGILRTAHIVRDRFTSVLPAGTFEWAHNNGHVTSIVFVCPCGCCELLALPVCLGARNGAWVWDGDIDTPTLSPSIHKKEGCGWHGRLQNGVFTWN